MLIPDDVPIDSQEPANRFLVPFLDGLDIASLGICISENRQHLYIFLSFLEIQHVRVSRVELLEAWKGIRAQVKKTSPNLEALLNSCKSLDVQDDTLVLGLASDVLVDKIEKPEQMEIIQKAMIDKLGVILNIRCVVTNAKGKVPADVDQNGLVAAAIQAGGEVVDI